MLIVINSLGGGHTHTHTHTHTQTHTHTHTHTHKHRHSRTEAILRNQAHAWFKKLVAYNQLQFMAKTCHSLLTL